MRALAISAGILVVVVLLIVVVSMVTVKRGEIEMSAQNKQGPGH
jgi:tetrahydromethanopterin S-methyltransferase subunit E